MSSTSPLSPRALLLVLPLVPLLLIVCGKKAASPAYVEQAKQTIQTQPIYSPDEPPPPLNGIALPKSYGRDTGDLDVMVKRRNIRALVILSPISFFYDKGQPRGVMYETLEEFQKFANAKLQTGQPGLTVTFIPMRIDQLEAALAEGLGDIIAYGVVITPDREKRVAFSTPILTDVTQIIVTGSSFGAISTIADLGGKEVYANPLTTYYQNLQKANEALRKDGKPLILVKRQTRT